jgi:hypothetical protein
MENKIHIAGQAQQKQVITNKEFTMHQSHIRHSSGPVALPLIEALPTGNIFGQEFHNGPHNP